MIRFETFDKDNLVIIKYTGQVDKDYMFSFMDFLYNSVDKENLKKALVDFREVNLTFSINDLKEILQARIKYSHGFVNRLNSVYIVQEAKETAFTTLYSKDLPPDIGRIMVCSTPEYAINLLNLNFSVTELEERIKNLSVTFES